LLTEWPRSEAPSDRQRIDRARQDAENLFKPRPRPPVPEAPLPALNGADTAEQQPRRQPRIFMIPPVVPMTAAKPVSRAEPKPIKRRPAVKREPLHIPSSQFGRVRALANYGMTHAQVAELYGVGVDEIERIVGQPAP
jgi:hypothetical protein